MIEFRNVWLSWLVGENREIYMLREARQTSSRSQSHNKHGEPERIILVQRKGWARGDLSERRCCLDARRLRCCSRMIMLTLFM